MATVQSIITRSLRRAGIVRLGEAPQARLSIEALGILNDMLYGLPSEGIDMRLDETRTAEFTLTDDFYFFVPSPDVLQSSVNQFSYQGTWDADSNTPTLTSTSGTDGYVYKVSVAGTTSLNGCADWAVNDFIQFGEPRADTLLQRTSGTDRAWFKSVDPRRFNDAVSAVLAVRLTEEMGHELSESMVYTAKKGRNALYNAFSKPKERDLFDTGLVYMPMWARFNPGEEL